MSRRKGTGDYGGKRVYARLDKLSEQALKDLTEQTGKSESEIIREALIEKAQRNATSEQSPERNKPTT